MLTALSSLFTWCMCPCMPMDARSRCWGSASVIFHSCLETGLLSEPGAHWLARLAWPVSSRYSPISASYLCLPVLNSNAHVCAGRAFSWLRPLPSPHWQLEVQKVSLVLERGGQSLSASVVKMGRWEGSISVFVNFRNYTRVVFPSSGSCLGLSIPSLQNSENSGEVRLPLGMVWGIHGDTRHCCSGKELLCFGTGFSIQSALCSHFPEGTSICFKRGDFPMVDRVEHRHVTTPLKPPTFCLCNGLKGCVFA